MTMPTSPAGWPEPPEEPRQSTSWSGIDPISFAWGHVKADLLGVVGPLFVALLLMLTPASIITGLQVALVAAEAAKGVMPDPTDPRTLGLQALAIVVGWIVQAYFQGGMYRFSLAVARGEKPAFGEVFSGFRVYGSSLVYVVVASFLFIPISFVRPGLKVLGAPQELATPLLLMFALPASLIWILLGLAMPAIADRGIGGVTAIGESVRLTAGHRGDMLLVGFLLFVLSGVGMCLCCLGTPIVSALLPLSLSFIYLKQTGQRVEEAG